METAKYEIFNNVRKDLWQWALQKQYEIKDGDGENQWGWSEHSSQIEFIVPSKKATICFHFEKQRDKFSIRIKNLIPLENYSQIKRALEENLYYQIGESEFWDEYLYVYGFTEPRNSKWQNWSNEEEILLEMIKSEENETKKQLQTWLEIISESLVAVGL